MILIVITFSILIGNFIFPFEQKEESLSSKFYNVFMLYKITVYINIGKVLLYIITIYFGSTEIHNQMNKAVPYINKDAINENITQELYNSFLEVCKHPDNYDLQREFTKLMLNRTNKSFDNDIKQKDISFEDKNSARNLQLSI